MVALCTAAPTTSLHIVKYYQDGIAMANETTVNYDWLEKNLPGQGDGRTHFFHQGPVFTEIK